MSVMLGNRASVRAQGETKTVKIWVDGIIDSFAWLWDGTTARSMADTLDASDAQVARILINTDGGDVDEGVAMMAALREFAAKGGHVITHNIGKAYSMGSLLMLAGDERKMARGANMMAHLPWANPGPVTAEQARDIGDILDARGEDMVKLYAQATGESVEQWREWLAKTTWWGAEQALAVPLIHEITEVVVAQAKIQPGTYHNIPARLLAIAKTETRETMPPEKLDESKANAKAIADQVAAAVIADQVRSKAIRTTGDKFGVSAAVIAAAIDGQTPAGDFLATTVDAWAGERPPHVSDSGRAVITPGEDAQDKLGASLQAAILARAGNLGRVEAGLELAAKNNRYPGHTTFDSANEHRGLSLKEMARLMLETSGVSTSRMTAKQMIGRAFMSGGVQGVLGPNSTSDFPSLLENTLHKVLLAEYELAAFTWSRFCAQGTVSDFREHPRYRQGSIRNLVKVNESGEIENAGIPDARREKISADEYALIIAITRKAIINDDLQAFSRIPQQLGRAAARTIEAAVYLLMAENAGLGPLMGDGLPLFDAAHKNISVGSVLSVAALDKDRQVFRSQQDESGNDFLDVLPDVLLTPLVLGSTARTIIGAEFDSDAGVPNNRTPNKVRSMVRDIVDSPRLDNNGTADALTRRYLFAEPGANPTIEVVRLAGEMGPSLEGRDGWRTSGREWKVVDDWGAGAVDYRTAVTNKGS